MNEGQSIALLEWSLDEALSRASAAERELADEKQKVANLEEYMLKGVAFRDELRSRVGELEKAIDGLLKVIASEAPDRISDINPACVAARAAVDGRE